MFKLLYPKIIHFLFQLGSELAVWYGGIPEVIEHYKNNCKNNKISQTPNPSEWLDTIDPMNYLAATPLS